MAIVVSSYRQTVRAYPGGRRRLHRQQGEPRHVRRAGRRGRAAVRLHDDGRRVDRGRRVRDRRRRSRGANQHKVAAVDRVRRARHAREPARRAGVRARCSRSPPTGSSCRSCVAHRWSGSCGASAGARRSCRHPSRSRRRRRSPAITVFALLQGVLVGCDGAHRGRGDLERRPGLQAAAGEERGRRRSRSWARSRSRCSSGSPASRRHVHGRRRERASAPSSPRSRIAVFGDGSLGFYVVQAFTAAILILAANTAYQDFPRLASILGARPVHAVPVREPRRPARVLQRRRSCSGCCRA